MSLFGSTSQKEESPLWTMGAMCVVALSVFSGKFVEGLARSDNVVLGVVSVLPVVSVMLVLIAFARNGSRLRRRLGRFGARSVDWVISVFAGLFFAQQYDIWVIPYPSGEVPFAVVFGIVNMAGVIFFVALGAWLVRSWARRVGVW